MQGKEMPCGEAQGTVVKVINTTICFNLSKRKIVMKL